MRKYLERRVIYILMNDLKLAEIFVNIGPGVLSLVAVCCVRHRIATEPTVHSCAIVRIVAVP